MILGNIWMEENLCANSDHYQCTRSLARRNVCWLKRNVGWHISHFTGTTTSKIGGISYPEKGG